MLALVNSCMAEMTIFMVQASSILRPCLDLTPHAASLWRIRQISWEMG